MSTYMVVIVQCCCCCLQFTDNYVRVCVCWQAHKTAMDLFRRAFQGKHAQLVKEIVVDNGLWTELQTRNVLTERQIRDCRSEVCHYWLLYVQIAMLVIGIFFVLNVSAFLTEHFQHGILQSLTNVYICVFIRKLISRICLTWCWV